MREAQVDHTVLHGKQMELEHALPCLGSPATGDEDGRYDGSKFQGK